MHRPTWLLPFSTLSHAATVIQAIPGFHDPVSSLSHLAAAAVGLVGAVPLVRHGRGCPIRFSSVAIYVLSVIGLLTISGWYHSLEAGPFRQVMRRLDYNAIWFLIAGTFTAIHGVMHRGRWRSWMLGVVWSLAIGGCVLQTYRFDLFSGPTGWILYSAFGWVGIFSIVKLGRQLGFQRIWPIWLSGIVYTVGAVLESRGMPTLVAGSIGPHEVFHICVILGIALHWMFIRQVVTEFAPRSALAKAPARVALAAGVEPVVAAVDSGGSNGAP